MALFKRLSLISEHKMLGYRRQIAEVYTDNEWDQLEPDVRSELETEYVLNNLILMKQIQDQSEWFNVSMDQLSIDVKECDGN